MEVKLKRGQKMCKACGTINGVRSFNCKKCLAPFTMKKRRKGLRRNVSFVNDYTQLNKGDVSKVIGGNGPYHTDEEGNKHYLTNRGKYIVDRIVNNGIMAMTQYGSHEFLYMGPEEKSPVLDTLTRAPHKVLIVKRYENES